MRTFISLTGQLLKGGLFGLVCGVVLVIGFKLTLAEKFDAQLAAYGERGNTDMPRNELTSDPTDGRIVQLETMVGEGTSSVCAGALVGPDLILTADHCLEGRDDDGVIYAQFGAHTEMGTNTYRASCELTPVLRTNQDYDTSKADYALLQVEYCHGNASLPGMNFGWYDLSTEKVKKGAELVALGYPADTPEGSLWESPGYSKGGCLITCSDHSYVVAMRIARGNSGGPVLQGGAGGDTIVGVVSAMRTTGDGIVQRVDETLSDEVDARNARTLP